MQKLEPGAKPSSISTEAALPKDPEAKVDAEAREAQRGEKKAAPQDSSGSKSSEDSCNTPSQGKNDGGRKRDKL